MSELILVFNDASWMALQASKMLETILKLLEQWQQKRERQAER